MFRELYNSYSDLHVASSYGLFRHMTGVGGRPEVVLEGSNDLAGPWVEFQFPYKPGSLDRMPPFLGKSTFVVGLWAIVFTVPLQAHDLDVKLP